MNSNDVWEYSEGSENNYTNDGAYRPIFPRCGTFADFKKDCEICIGYSSYDTQ